MKIISENMCFTDKNKQTRFGFQKAFFQKVHLEKGGSSYNQGRLIFGSIRYYIFYHLIWLYCITKYIFGLLMVHILIFNINCYIISQYVFLFLFFLEK